MKKKILIKGGKVHNVGYRLFLMNIADDFGIENFDAKNVKENGAQAIQVLVESSEETIKEFFNCIKRDVPEHAKVESFDIKNYGGIVKRVDSFRLGFMAVQQQKFVDVGIAMLGELSEIKANTSRIPKIEEYTSRIPEIEENTAETSHSLGELLHRMAKIEHQMVEVRKILKLPG